ncbi:MAG: phosphoenolpyruvate carboxylase [Bowdeniella nasicola]|nr:phosphoenolpyruvate carboxylase [Bowdeniella nasicola]
MTDPTRSAARLALPETLRSDVRRLGDALGVVLTRYGGEELLTDVERLRSAVIAARREPQARLDDAEAIVASYSSERAIEVSRAFTCYFHLVNLAEEAYRVRVLTERDDPAAEAEQGEAASLARAYLHARQRVGVREADALLDTLTFHPVLTAHPTEARRRAVAAPIRELTALVNERHRAPSARRRRAIDREIERAVETLWLTAQLRPAKPSPLDEVATALDTVTQTIYPALVESVERFADSLDAWGVRADVHPFVRLGTWIGGDRDGNPHVTAHVTRAAAAAFHQRALELLSQEAEQCGRSLTQDARHTPPSGDLTALLAEARLRDEDTFAAIERDAPGEPHRQAVMTVANRLRATARRDATHAYPRADDALADLRLVADSLRSTGARRAAEGPLRRLIWRLEATGFHLAELEVRQHSEIHRRALAVLEGREAGGEVDLDEVLATFRAIAAIQRTYGERAAGRYIVSFTRSAEDLATVYALADYAADGGTPARLDVIPLFETFEDLANAPRILAQMLDLEPVARRLEDNGRRLEVMLGYSDSAKDVGPVSAILALDEAQRAITAWAEEAGVHLTLFHGRGGALGRGGGPAQRAIMSQPPGSVATRFKVTEQGEVIAARYGHEAIALRHIDQVSAAALLSSLPDHARALRDAEERFAGLARILDRAAREAFEALVHAEGFPEWFSTVTPQQEVGWLALGSRPASRGLAVTSLEDLRAIPWVFAWTQARVNLTGWFGLGSALESVGDPVELATAYREWPLFTTLIDNVEMSLAKTDWRIAEKYLELGSRPDLAELVRAEYERTRRWVLRLVERDTLLGGHRILGQAVQLRNPYVDALSLLQLRALRSVRRGTDTDLDRRLLLITVKGVAAGLQNTG